MRRDGQAAADWRRRVEHPRLQLGALALLLVAIAAVIYHETRGTSFLFDDWSWILNRRGGSLGTYLDPHNQHLSLIPIAIYKLLLATFGIGSYVPYRVVMIAITLLLYGLFYTYENRAWARGRRSCSPPSWRCSARAGRTFCGRSRSGSCCRCARRWGRCSRSSGTPAGATPSPSC